LLPSDKAEELKQREEERMKRAVVKEWDESFDDEDDFYDRAGGFSSAKGHTTRRVETIDSLKAKLAVLLAQKELVGLEVEEITNKNASGAKEQEDELESFMQGLSADMEKKELRKKEDLLRDLTQEIARVERLIEVVQPAIDRAGGKQVKKVQAGLAADVERIKQDYIARMGREKQKEIRKKERAKRKLQEIKEIEKQEEEERKIVSASILQKEEPAEQAISEDDGSKQKESQERPNGEEKTNEDDYVMDDHEAAERRKERNRKKREKKREREREQKKPRFDDEVVMDEEHQELGYGYSEWVPPAKAQHYSL